MAQMQKGRVHTAPGQNGMSFNQLVEKLKAENPAGAKPAELSKEEAAARKKAKDETVAKISNYVASKMKNSYNSQAMIIEALETIAEAYLNSGAITTKMLPDLFPNKAMPLRARFTDHQTLASVSITTQGGKRMLVFDLSDAKAPLLLFIGKPEEASSFLKDYAASDSARASLNGHGGIFKPIQDYFAAKAELANSQPR